MRDLGYGPVLCGSLWLTVGLQSAVGARILAHSTVVEPVNFETAPRTGQPREEAEATASTLCPYEAIQRQSS